MNPRKLQNSLKKRTKILLDTSFILPFFGIRVSEIPEYVIDLIPKMSRNFTFIYPKLMISELIAKISKECIKTGRQVSLLKHDFETFLAQVDITIVDPTPEQLILAMELRVKGHRDIFDCIAYSTAKYEKALFLTIDDAFVDFLKANNYDISFIISYTNLKKLLT